MQFAFLDIWHVSWMIIYFAGTIGLCFWLKSKSIFFQKKIIYSMILFNFVVHFVGPWIIFDTMEQWLLRSTMVNTCAVLVFLSPFLYWQQDKFLKPGWLYMCIVGAFGLIAFPEYAIGQSPFSFNLIRLFVQHAILLFVPVLMVVLGHEKLNFRDTWSSCVFYIFILIIVIANDAILQSLGVTHNMRWWNGAFQWHPGNLYNVVNIVVPEVFMTVPFGENAGTFMYWPIIYMLPVIALLVFPFSVLITWILNKSYHKISG